MTKLVQQQTRHAQPVHSRDTRFYIVAGLFLLLLFLSYLVLQPYLITILTAVIVAMLFYPVHSYLRHRIEKPTLAAFCTTALVFLIIVIPASIFISTLAADAYDAYLGAQSFFSGTGPFIDNCAEGFGCVVNNQLKELVHELKLQGVFAEIGKSARELSLSYGGDAILFVIRSIIKIFIFVLMLFYLFRDGDILVEKLKMIIPLDEQKKKYLFQKTNETLSAVMYGVLLTGVIQGILATVLYLLVGLPSPVLLGMITFIGALTIGTWIVWVPAGLWMLLAGITGGDRSLVIGGIVVLVVGAIVISALDNFLRPYLIGRKSQVPFPVIVLGLIGGLQFFGLIGIFVGPVLLSLLIITVRLYTEK